MISAFAALNLSGLIRSTVAARVNATFPLQVAGRIQTKAAAQTITTLQFQLVGGRIQSKVAVRGAFLQQLLFGRIQSRVTARVMAPLQFAGRIQSRVTARTSLALQLQVAGRIRSISTAQVSMTFAPELVLVGRIKSTVSFTTSASFYPRLFLTGQITSKVAARTGYADFPIQIQVQLVGRIATTVTARTAYAAVPFVLLSGHIKSTVSAGVSFPVPIIPVHLAGLIKSKVSARTHSILVPPVYLAGLITTRSKARVAFPAPAYLFGFITTKSTARILVGNFPLPLFGSITATSAANVTPFFSAILSGRTHAFTKLFGIPPGPYWALIGGRITSRIKAAFAAAEQILPLPPYPLPFPTQPLEHYLNYITSEHNQKPKYLQTVTVSVDPFVEDQILVAGIPGLFDLDYSVGQQEDFTGQWIGKSRWIELPTGFFSWDTETVGWNQANWKGPFDAANKLQRLDDYHYRLLLYAAVIANHWNGSVPAAYEAWDTLFHYSGLKVVIQDYGNMTMMYGLLWDQEPDTVLLSLLTTGQMDLKPEGIALIDYVFQAEPNVPFFAFDAESDAVNGWDTGYWGKLVPPGFGFVPLTTQSGDPPNE